MADLGEGTGEGGGTPLNFVIKMKKGQKGGKSAGQLNQNRPLPLPSPPPTLAQGLDPPLKKFWFYRSEKKTKQKNKENKLHTRTPTHGLASTLTNAQRHITWAVAAKDTCFGLFGIAVRPKIGLKVHST